MPLPALCVPPPTLAAGAAAAPSRATIPVTTSTTGTLRRAPRIEGDANGPHTISETPSFRAGEDHAITAPDPRASGRAPCRYRRRVRGAIHRQPRPAASWPRAAVGSLPPRGFLLVDRRMCQAALQHAASASGAGTLGGADARLRERASFRRRNGSSIHRKLAVATTLETANVATNRTSVVAWPPSSRCTCSPPAVPGIVSGGPCH